MLHKIFDINMFIFTDIDSYIDDVPSISQVADDNSNHIGKYKKQI